MAFEKGWKGGPGRPRKTKEQIEFEKKCQSYLDQFGFEQIKDLAKSSDKQSKKWALEVMLDRGFGRPAEVLDVTQRDDAAPNPGELAGEIADLLGERPSQGAADNQPTQGTA